MRAGIVTGSPSKRAPDAGEMQRPTILLSKHGLVTTGMPMGETAT
jgi:hypothetical protein